MGLFKYLKEKFKGKKEQEEIREKYVAGLDKSRKNFSSKLNSLAKKYVKINSEYFDELEEILIEADVGVRLTSEIISETNPLYALIELDNIKEAMISIDSQNKTYYEERYNIYSSYISNLDSLLENLFSPYENYKFVTSHEAFGYFANRYNLQEISINGLSPEDEPTPNKLAELVKEINELNINTIFYESFSSSSISETISKETNTAISTLSTLENVSKDELFNDYNSLILENSLKLLESFKKYGTID